MKQVWLITGIPGAGKTTVARRLASRIERAVHIEGDRLQEWIVSGAVWPGEKPRDESARQIQLNIKNQCLLARSFSEAGFMPVLDYVVAFRQLLNLYRQHLEGYALRFVVLAPSVDVALRRDADRLEKTVAAVWAHLELEMRRELAGMGLWIDSSELTVEQTIDLIVANQEQALLPQG